MKTSTLILSKKVIGLACLLFLSSSNLNLGDYSIDLNFKLDFLTSKIFAVVILLFPDVILDLQSSINCYSKLGD